MERIKFIISPMDFSDNPEWIELSRRYARAQAKFDEMNLGWERVWQVKFERVGNRPLNEVSPQILEQIIKKVVRIYERFK